jgi:hypothetical protein
MGSAKVRPDMLLFHKTKRGQILLGDSLEYMASLKAVSVELVNPRLVFRRR